MKREDIKVGVRVRQTDSNTRSYNQVGTVMDTDPPLLWIKFDDNKYNHMLVPRHYISTDVGTHCTACHYESLEVI